MSHDCDEMKHMNNSPACLEMLKNEELEERLRQSRAAQDELERPIENLTQEEEEQLAYLWYKFALAIHNTARKKGFYDDAYNFGEKIALMHTELSEALEGRRENPNKIDPHCPLFQNLSIEFADLHIRLMDTEIYENLNVIQAMFAKHKYNQTRPFKHGKGF